MTQLDGKIALVTGGSRGIGREIATRLAADGALVAVHYGTNKAAAEETVTRIAQSGGQAFTVGAELGIPGDARALWAAFDAGLHRIGIEPGLDILVNNAGVTGSSDLAGTTEAEFDRIFAVNVKAPFFILQQGIERLRDNGRVINISSGVTRIASPALVTYSLTKGAINTLSHTLAKQLGERGITVNAVAPGIVDVDSNAGWLRDDPEQLAVWGSFSPVNRVGQPSDIAGAVAFLASDDSRWITGQYLDATGGAHL
ncbi:SDR family oxidoreductase [Actinoplanes derwentensis]|uniref:3-oxoacyl-[acyl-carrier protein] reductase n=1 Tax=Actinoplanes derwentensis TaxID=113562 RepID=A0A1H1Z1H6_9ACTN|nr:SDR family oxidoreductase [Actinoplanes derwentensis]GID81365.1 short-chain dehydrogenase [Actinoplanes derwentensis]SDT27036.1 3-oxoacyl-[acyl-carrier protein] reductase [Actinoplanes derwentensis]